MNRNYDYHTRENNNSWLLKHIEVLLEEAEKYKNISFVFYAAFESRNLLEKTEFDLILMSQNEEDKQNLIEIAKGKNGLRKTNEKYKTLKYKFQTFNEALCRVIIDDIRVQIFDYTKSGNLQTELGEYMHVYTLSENDYNYNSQFIQNGIAIINDTLNFIKSYYTLTNSGFVYGIINFNSIKGSIKQAFDNWKNSSSFDTQKLFEELNEINQREFNGKKISIINSKIQ